MVANMTGNGNGIHSNGMAFPLCPSDYEPRPTASTPTPAAPAKPGWRDQFPLFTDHVSWTDSDGVTHGLTLRSDSLAGLMADLKLVKSMIRQAKAKHSSRQEKKQSATEAQGQEPDVQHCKMHSVDMLRRWSKRTQGHYFGHKLPSGDFCYGKAK